MDNEILRVQSLEACFGKKNIFSPISFSLYEGKTTTLFGPSGCGKSTIALIISLLSDESIHLSGHVTFNGRDIFSLKEREKREYRKKIGYVFQNPMMAFSPFSKIIRAFEELHVGKNKNEIIRIGRKYFSLLSLDERYLFSYPDELSGGMRIKANLALSLSGNPAVLVLDEVTRSLDRKSKEEVLSLLERVQRENNTAYLLITHEKDVEMRMSDDTIFFKGQDKKSSSKAIVKRKAEDEVVLSIKALTKSFGEKKVLDNVSLEVKKGERIGITGRTGSGKSTLLGLIASLYPPDSGNVIRNEKGTVLLFQDPFSSLDPKMRVKDVLREPMEIYQKRGWMKKMRKKEMDEITYSSLNSFGIDESLFERKIKYLSGGEREKVYLMSALMVEPRLLLLDEALASLDEESSENLINELFAKSEEYNFALVFVSHNYKLVERIADKIYLLEDGKLTRVAPS